MNGAAQFLALSEGQRSLAFEQTAAVRGLDPVIVEKDFWVCWLLGVLWGIPSIAPHVVFKGGTSLSKVYRVIDRFSEDIDLSLAPEFVGASTAWLNTEHSATKRLKAMRSMQQRCAVTVKDRVRSELEHAISTVLGAPEHGDSWLDYQVDEDALTPVLFFRYPSKRIAGAAYVLRSVKLELGSLTDQQPTGRHAISPIVAEQYPALFVDWACEVVALDLARTFWEKATILHAEHYRTPDMPSPSRYARHYADVARMLFHPGAGAFLVDEALCARVVAWKHLWFPRTWARYDLAAPGSFRLTPSPNRRDALLRDYAAMLPMFMGEPPLFSQVLEQLTDAERTINRA